MRIFTIRHYINIAIRINIRFYIFRVERGLVTRGSYNRDINEPLL